MLVKKRAIYMNYKSNSKGALPDGYIQNGLNKERRESFIFDRVSLVS